MLYIANRVFIRGGVCKSTNRLDGKLAIVTGSNTGLGYETAKDLAQRGAHVILACRDARKAEKAALEIIKRTNNRQVDVELLDLSDLDSVRSFVKLMHAKYDKLDLLINNAGKRG